MSPAIWSNAVLGERKGWVIAWSAVLLALFVVVTAILVAFGSDQPGRQVIGSAIPLALLALFYWLCYVRGAVRQNSPANARLVPGLHRAVRRTTILTWCLTLAPLALLSSGFEHAALAFVALTVMMTAIGMASGGSAGGSIIYGLIVLAFSLVAGTPDVMARLSTAPVLAAMYALGAALAWQGLRSVFPAGGERHWKLLTAQENQRAVGDLQRVMLSRRAAGGRASLYGWLLRRDLRPSARPEHLLLHAIGPGNHRFDFVRYLLPLLLLAIVARLVLEALGLGSLKAPVEMIAIMAASVLPLQGPNFQRLVVSMDNTRGEQALVRLAPRAPRADRLGRVLARQMLRVCLSEWLAAGVGVLALIFLFGGGGKHLMLFVSLMATGLAMTGWILRDYARKQGGALATVIMQTLLVGAGGIALFVARDNPAAWSVLLVLQTGVALAIVHSRWKTMVGAPVPFPAGRFA